MLSTLPLFYIAQSVDSDDRRARFQGLRVIMLRHDCSKSNEFLTPACFSKGNASLCTGARNSSLDDNF